MRYLLQLIVMIGDIAIIGASAVAIYLGWKSPIVWILVIMCFKTWNDTGAFQAWNPKTIHQFLSNGKKIGL